MLEMPEGPAVAGVEALHVSRDAMNRTGPIGTDERAISADFGTVTAARSRQHSARLEQSAFDQCAERNARLGFLGPRDGKRVFVGRDDRFDASSGDAHVFGVALDADEAAPEPASYGARGAGTEERVEHDVV